ncbi:hypothetical protein GGI25_005881 [Coemansia spiralis]|uniref:5'-deoxynucleotidase n=2 Tax=Coemansia TaxID=4863 RepID=A0A9W8FXW0_9FUNG|nr:HD domain-containing protein [Coemansia spiralis]KAJ1992768.1 hypothetical protein EDC05_002552 [Coemansia umbellata]KAJ2622575.1 hypothetical protein GGI26_003174 [Coemansia sp. RSA 1358]KAJ2670299.1 hypothetical protein GGI25_005881 [Coemansia spiralis]
MSSASNVIDFLHTVEQLKRTKRTGWLNNKIPNPESIADHMYRLGIMAMLLDDPQIDKTKCIKMALVHDLAESLVGDIAPSDNVPKEVKYQLEAQGMQKLADTLGNTPAAKEIHALWIEYENNETEESSFVHDLDKCEMILQALEYEKSDDKKLDEFYECTRGIFKHPQVQSWVEEIYKRRSH